jgi:hypothetical protein
MCDFVGTALNMDALTPAEVRKLEEWASNRQSDLSKQILHLQEQLGDVETRLAKANRAHDRVMGIVKTRDENGRAVELTTGVADR